jgi:hypothetical protein
MIDVNGHNYSIGKLSARQQFDIVRRLGGVEFWFEQETAEDHVPGARWIGAIVTGAASTIPQADIDFILETSLSVVRRHAGGNGAGAPIMAPNGRMMFEDIDMETMLELSDQVLQEALGPFFEKRRQRRAAVEAGQNPPAGDSPDSQAAATG